VELRDDTARDIDALKTGERVTLTVTVSRSRGTVVAAGGCPDRRCASSWHRAFDAELSGELDVLAGQRLSDL